MNLLLINYEYPPIGGGAATATEQIARALAGLGHRVTVLTAAFGDLRGEVDERGVTLVRVPALRSRADRSSLVEMASYVASALQALPRILRQHRPEACIVFFSVPCGPIAWLAARRTGLPYVVSLRGGDVPGTERGLDRMHRLLAPLRRRILAQARAVVANSPGLQQLSEQADPTPVCVIPNGVDCETFRPADAAPTHREQGCRFLFVGRLNDQKNVALLLDAFAAMAAGDQSRLRIVGDGPLKGDLLQQSRRLKLDERIEWLGWQARSAMPAIYASADCLINPSRYEGMANAVLEAMACGLPVIASAVAGNRDVVDDGVSGILFADGDGDSLARAMARIAGDREFAASLGVAARQAVVERYSWIATAKAYLALFSPDKPGEPHAAV